MTTFLQLRSRNSTHSVDACRARSQPVCPDHQMILSSLPNVLRTRRKTTGKGTTLPPISGLTRSKAIPGKTGHVFRGAGIVPRNVDTGQSDTVNRCRPACWGTTLFHLPKVLRDRKQKPHTSDSTRGNPNMLVFGQRLEGGFGPFGADFPQ